MTPRNLAVIVAMIALVSTGCGKKKSDLYQQTVTPPSVAEQKDTTDVFEEFYSDTKEPEKKVSPTFSMNETASYTPVFKSNGAYVVQIAAMGSRTLANELATEMKEKGYPAYVSEVQNPRQDLQGTFYRVRIGNFASIPEAKAFGENVILPTNHSFWVDRKSNDNAPSEDRQTRTDYSPPPAPPTTLAPAPSPAPPQPDESATSSSWSDNPSTW
jgi:hypothetical protein